MNDWPLKPQLPHLLLAWLFLPPLQSLLHSPHQPPWQLSSCLQPQLRCLHLWRPHKCLSTDRSISNTTVMKTLSTSGAKTGDRTGGRCGASSVMRRGTLPTVVLLAPCCSAFYGNMPKSKPGALHPQVKYWSYLLPMATLKPPQCI